MASNKQIITDDTQSYFDPADKNDFQARYWIPTIWVENLRSDLKIASAQSLVDYCVATIKPEACCTRLERCPTSGKLHAHLFIQMPTTVRLWSKLTKAFGTAGVHVLYARRDGENAKSYSVKVSPVIEGQEPFNSEAAYFNIDPASVKPWGVLGGKAGSVQKGPKSKSDTRSLSERAIAWAEQKISREAAESKLLYESIRAFPLKFDIYKYIKIPNQKEIDAEYEKMRAAHSAAADAIANENIAILLAKEYGVSLEEARGFAPAPPAETYVPLLPLPAV